MFFNKKKRIPPRMEHKTYTVRLMHDFGHEMEINNVSEDSLRFIRNNLGRDEIYVQDTICINLKSYSWANIQTKDIIRKETSHG